MADYANFVSSFNKDCFINWWFRYVLRFASDYSTTDLIKNKNYMNRNLILTLLVCISATACQAERTPLPLATSTPTYTADQLIPTPRYDPLPTSTKTRIPTVTITATSATQETLTTPSTSTTGTVTPFPDEWMKLPVIPVVDSNVLDIYELGQSLGNDPNAFSIFGDCQSTPDEFLGVFETDQAAIDSLSSDLQETVNNFNGSFNRESPTSQDGTTPGALLWDQWHRGEYRSVQARHGVAARLCGWVAVLPYAPFAEPHGFGVKEIGDANVCPGKVGGDGGGDSVIVDVSVVMIADGVGTKLAKIRQVGDSL